MKSHHPDIELLCALAVTGDLDEAGQEALRVHLGYCTCCRTYLLELSRLDAGLALTREWKNSCKLPTGMRERFILRAAREGIVLQAPVPWSRCSGLHFATAFLVVLFLATATLKAGPFFRSAPPRPTLSASLPRRKAEPPQAANVRPSHSLSPNSRRTRINLKATEAMPVALEHRQFLFTPALLQAVAPTFALSRQQRSIPSFTFRFSPALLAEEEIPQVRNAGPNFQLLKVDFSADGYRRMQIEGASAQ